MLALSTAVVSLFYVWFFMPIIGGYLSQPIVKVIFFAFFAIGMFGIFLCTCKHVRLTVSKPILLYFLAFTAMLILGAADSAKHVRISFSFWGTGLLYDLIEGHPRYKNKLAAFFLIMFIIVVLTTCWGVIVDSHAVRRLAHAANDINEDIALMKKNVSGLYLIQSFIVMLPILFGLLGNKLLLGKKEKWLMAAFLAIGFAMIIKASLTISILVAAGVVVMLILYGILRNRRKQERVIILLIALILLIVLLCNIGNIFGLIARVAGNNKVQARFKDLSDLFRGVELQQKSDIKTRARLYSVSFDTFLKHPLGIGPFYSYHNMENGIGYHSQFLDDLARFGIFALAFYVYFFWEYRKLLKREYRKIDLEWVVDFVVAIYFLFLVLNLGFRSGVESVVLLFLIPSFPTLLTAYTKRRMNKRKDIG